MANFSQKQLGSLETLNAQPISTISKRSNPALISSQATGLIHSTQQFQLKQSKSNAVNKKILHNIETNQTLQTNILVDTLGHSIAEPLNTMVDQQNVLLDLNHEMISDLRTMYVPPKLMDKISFLQDDIKSLFSLNQDVVKEAQFNRGIGRDARFANKLAGQLRTSMSAAIAFSTPVKRMIRPNMSIEQKQLAVLVGLHDIARFSGQELIAIRQGNTSNDFGVAGFDAANEHFLTRITDSLQTTPIMAPLIEAGKLAVKATNALVHPTRTLMNGIDSFKSTLSNLNPFKKFLSSGSDLAVKAGLELDHKNLAFQFLGTTFPDIAQETNDILNRQLGVQENIQNVLEETLSVITGNPVKKRVNTRDYESQVFDPFLGQYVSKKEANKLASDREEQMFNVRRNERGLFSKLTGYGSKQDRYAAQDAQGTTVNKQFQTHQDNQYYAEGNTAPVSTLADNVRSGASKIKSGFGAAKGVIGGIDSVAESAANWMYNLVIGKSKPDNIINIQKYQSKPSDQSTDVLHPKIEDWQQTIMDELPKLATLSEASLSLAPSSVSPTTSSTSVVSRLKKRDKKSVEQDLLTTEDEELETLKGIKKSLGRGFNKVSKKKKKGFDLFGMLGSIGGIVGKVVNTFSNLASAGISAVAGIGTFVAKVLGGGYAIYKMGKYLLGKASSLVKWIGKVTGISSLASKTSEVAAGGSKVAEIAATGSKASEVISGGSKVAGALSTGAEVAGVAGIGSKIAGAAGSFGSKVLGVAKFIGKKSPLIAGGALILDVLNDNSGASVTTKIWNAIKESPFTASIALGGMIGLIPGMQPVAAAIVALGGAWSLGKMIHDYFSGASKKKTPDVAKTIKGSIQDLADAKSKSLNEQNKSQSLVDSVSSNPAVKSATAKVKELTDQALVLKDQALSKGSSLVDSVSSNPAVKSATAKVKELTDQALVLKDQALSKGSSLVDSVSSNPAVMSATAAAKGLSDTVSSFFGSSKSETTSINTSTPSDFVSSVISKGTNIIDSIDISATMSKLKTSTTNFFSATLTKGSNIIKSLFGPSEEKVVPTKGMILSLKDSVMSKSADIINSISPGTINTKDKPTGFIASIMSKGSDVVDSIKNQNGITPSSASGFITGALATGSGLVSSAYNHGMDYINGEQTNTPSTNAQNVDTTPGLFSQASTGLRHMLFGYKGKERFVRMDELRSTIRDLKNSGDQRGASDAQQELLKLRKQGIKTGEGSSLSGININDLELAKHMANSKDTKQSIFEKVLNFLGLSTTDSKAGKTFISRYNNMFGSSVASRLSDSKKSESVIGTLIGEFKKNVSDPLSKSLKAFVKAGKGTHPLTASQIQASSVNNPTSANAIDYSHLKRATHNYEIKDNKPGFFSRGATGLKHLFLGYHGKERFTRIDDLRNSIRSMKQSGDQKGAAEAEKELLKLSKQGIKHGFGSSLSGTNINDLELAKKMANTKSDRGWFKNALHSLNIIGPTDSEAGKKFISRYNKRFGSSLKSHRQQLKDMAAAKKSEHLKKFNKTSFGKVANFLPSKGHELTNYLGLTHPKELTAEAKAKQDRIDNPFGHSNVGDKLYLQRTNDRNLANLPTNKIMDGTSRSSTKTTMSKIGDFFIPDVGAAVMPIKPGSISTPSINIQNIKPNMSSISGGTKDIGKLIHSTSNKYGVPEPLINAIVKTESDFNPNARSGVGAQGLMQLMPATAKDLGISDPFDPAQNLDGGVRYIGTLLKRYNGNVPRALAAYNWGMGNVDRKGLGQMPAETRNYVSKITGLLSSGNNVAFNNDTGSNIAMPSPTNQPQKIQLSSVDSSSSVPTSNTSKDSNTSTPSTTVAQTASQDSSSSILSMLDSKLSSVVTAISQLVQPQIPQADASPSEVLTEHNSLQSIVDNLFSAAPNSVSNQAVSFSGLI